MSEISSVEEIRSSLRKFADRRSLREIAGEVGVSHTTLYEFVGGGAPSERTERMVREWLAAQEGEGEEPVNGDWLHDVLKTVRRANGESGEDLDEKRRIQADILVGCIRLGRLEGRDVRALEIELARLGVPVEEARGTRSLMAFYDRESRAAEIRAEGARELSIAARLEIEEARARRLGISSAPLTPADMELAKRMVDIVNPPRPAPSTPEDQPRPPGPQAPHGQ